MIIEIEDFYENIDELVEQAKKQEFGTLVDPSSGAEYQNMAIAYGINFHKLEKGLGHRLVYNHPPIYRKYDKNTINPTYIHTDASLGEFTAILYLDKGKSNGTAFWKHKETNSDKFEIEKLSIAQIEQVTKDTFDESKWELVQVVESKYNKLVLFDSKLYHSMYPKQVRGNKERLIFVGFLIKW